MSNITFHQIPSSIVDHMNYVLDYLQSNNIGVEYNSTYTVDSFQTEVLIHQSEEFDEVLDNVLKSISFDDKFETTNFHMIHYTSGGYQQKHIHEESNYSYILYLNDCNSGETIFYFDDGNVRVKPQKGKLILFPADSLHEAEVVKDGDIKRVAVGSLEYRKNK